MNSSIFQADVFFSWALCAVFLFLKMFANTAVQGYAKLRDRVASLPEDRKYLGAHARDESTSDLYERAADCWTNDLENIPMFLILGFAYIGVGGSHAVAQAIFISFCVARTAHTVTYLCGWQPWRSIAYTVGALAATGLVVGILKQSF